MAIEIRSIVFVGNMSVASRDAVKATESDRDVVCCRNVVRGSKGPGDAVVSPSRRLLRT